MSAIVVHAEDALMNKADVLPSFLGLKNLLVKVKTSNEEEVMADTSKRPNLHITRIPERKYHLKTGEEVKFHSYKGESPSDPGRSYKNVKRGRPALDSQATHSQGCVKRRLSMGSQELDMV